MKTLFISMILLFISHSSFSQIDTIPITLTRSIWIYSKSFGDISHRSVIDKGASFSYVPLKDSDHYSAFIDGRFMGYIDAFMVTSDYQSGKVAYQDTKGHLAQSGFSTIQRGANTALVGKLLMIAGGVLAAVSDGDKSLVGIGVGVAGFGLCLDLLGTGSIAKGARILKDQK